MIDIQQDYFSLLGVPPHFDIDLSQISERYLALQKQLHPDKFAHANEREQRLAVQYTTYLNEAMTTLKSPLLRAQYLLSLQGVDTYHDHSVTIDPDFLFAQMTLREELENVSSSSDPFTVLASLSDRVQAQLRVLEGEFQLAYQQRHNHDLESAISAVRKMQFLTKLAHEVEQTENDLDDY